MSVFNIDTDINPALVLLDQFDSLSSGNPAEVVLSAVQGVCGEKLSRSQKISPHQIYICTSLPENTIQTLLFSVYIGKNLVKQFDRNNSTFWEESTYVHHILAFAVGRRGTPRIVTLTPEMMINNGKKRNGHTHIYMIPPKHKWTFFLEAIDRYYN